MRLWPAVTAGIVARVGHRGDRPPATVAVAVDAAQTASSTTGRDAPEPPRSTVAANGPTLQRTAYVKLDATPSQPDTVAVDAAPSQTAASTTGRDAPEPPWSTMAANVPTLQRTPYRYVKLDATPSQPDTVAVDADDDRGHGDPDAVGATPSQPDTVAVDADDDRGHGGPDAVGATP